MQRSTDNTNVNIIPMGDALVALTEGPRQLRIDAGSLRSLGVLLAHPVTVKPMAVRWSNRGDIDHLRWRPQDGTRCSDARSIDPTRQEAP